MDARTIRRVHRDDSNRARRSCGSVLRSHFWDTLVSGLWAYRTLNGVAPPYLDQLVRVADRPGRHRLSSSSSHRLQVPAYRLATVGQRSFPVAASIFWNSLPPGIQSSSSLTDFCHKPKTYLFYQSFPDIFF